MGPCGQLRPNNAFFCSKANTIFYDEIFLTRMMKTVGLRLNSDGDYAPVMILAHEWGHALQFWMAQATRRPPPPTGQWSYPREAEADCFAGAITRRAEAANLLDPGDVREGVTALQLAGDAPMNDAEVWRMVAHGHGTSVQRVQNFRRGYVGGAAACNSLLSSGAADLRQAPR
jgi:predicted metalloprotease